MAATNVPEREWHVSGIGCFKYPGKSIIACFCPCVSFGKTYDVIENDSTKPECCNAGCWLYAVLLFCGLNCIYQIFQRGSLRDKFNLRGGFCTDCLCGCCCVCCDLVQQEAEAEYRIKQRHDRPPPHKGAADGKHGHDQYHHHHHGHPHSAPPYDDPEKSAGLYSPPGHMQYPDPAGHRH